MKLRLIVNPISGTKSASAKRVLADDIERRLQDMGFEVDTTFTTCSGDAERLARAAIDSHFDGVLACGGDGTVNETARAMIGSAIPMGILPAGSGNGLARHIGIPIDPVLALDIIEAKHLRDCDYATVNGTPFFCTFGVGFDADVADRFANSGQRGLMTYVKSAFQEFSKFNTRQYRITLDGKVIERDAFLVAVCNASQYGNNAYIAPQASITDGLLNVIIVKRSSRLRTFMIGFDLMSGLISDNSIIETYQVKNVRIERSDDAPAHLDGEPLHPGTDLNISCHHAKLKLFTAPDKQPFKPILTPAEALFTDLGNTFSHLF